MKLLFTILILFIFVPFSYANNLSYKNEDYKNPPNITQSTHISSNGPIYFSMKDNTVTINLKNRYHLFYVSLIQNKKLLPISKREFKFEQYKKINKKCNQQKGIIVGRALENGKYKCMPTEISLKQAIYLCEKSLGLEFKFAKNKLKYSKIKCVIKGIFTYV